MKCAPFQLCGISKQNKWRKERKENPSLTRENDRDEYLLCFFFFLPPVFQGQQRYTPELSSMCPPGCWLETSSSGIGWEELCPMVPQRPRHGSGSNVCIVPSSRCLNEAVRMAQALPSSFCRLNPAHGLPKDPEGGEKPSRGSGKSRVGPKRGQASRLTRRPTTMRSSVHTDPPCY